MNIYQLYGKIGPWATPAPAAIALSGRLYGEWSKTDPITAWAIALFSLAALEVVGGLCSYQAIRTSLDKRWGWFAVCLAGVFAYVGLGIYALWGLTAWIYVVLAVFVHVAVAAELAAGLQRVEVIEDKTLALALEKERTRQLQAEARKAKAEQIVFPKAFGVQVDGRPVSSGQAGQCRADIAELLKAAPNLSAREIGRRLNISPTTASEHKKLWEKALTEGL